MHRTVSMIGVARAVQSVTRKWQACSALWTKENVRQCMGSGKEKVCLRNLRYLGPSGFLRFLCICRTYRALKLIRKLLSNMPTVDFRDLPVTAPRPISQFPVQPAGRQHLITGDPGPPPLHTLSLLPSC